MLTDSSIFRRRINGVYLFACAPRITALQQDRFIVMLEDSKTGKLLSGGAQSYATIEDAELAVEKLIGAGATADVSAQFDQEHIKSLISRVGTVYEPKKRMKAFTNIFEWQMAVIDTGLDVMMKAEGAYYAYIPDSLYSAMLFHRYIKGQNPEVIGQDDYGHFNVRLQCGALTI